MVAPGRQALFLYLQLLLIYYTRDILILRRNIIQTLRLVSPVPVSVNHYMKPRPFIAHGKPCVTMYESADAKEYKKQFSRYIKEQVKLQKYVTVPNKTQHFYCDCVFYFDRIDRDANNYFKLLLDAITDSQCVWIDDNVVCERVNAIYYDSRNPRIEISIYPVDYIGIFPNKESMTEFKLVCTTCSRYRDGRCSLLLKAIEGHIQNEIANYTCNKYKTKKEKK